MAVEQTLTARLAACGGRPSGFDYMRIALAITVLGLHSVSSSYGKLADVEVWVSPLRPVMRSVLPMFFTLSGFLVAGSLIRSKTIIGFLGLRVIRIYPALAVEVFLSALLLGPLLTTVSLSTYFSSSDFWLYLVNITGHIHYFLPGVFETNPSPRMVNAQLWTVPFELLCYASISILFAFGVLRRPWIAPAGALALTLGYGVGRWCIHGGRLPIIPGGLPGQMLVISFLWGVTLYLYGDRIKWSRGLFLASVVASAASLGILLVPAFRAASPYGDLIAPIPVAYMTIYLGLTDFRKLGFVKHADYSYGVYLYGCVIQQSMMYLLPWARIWWLNILICLPITILFAALSWHVVEKPAQALKSQVKVVERFWLNLIRRPVAQSVPTS